MNPLLYSSKEMFSSTELIRKSKMIFDKLLSNEVEKAIILRDGKPGFMLLEFEKYEKLMKEYIALKEQMKSLDSVNNETQLVKEIIESEKKVMIEKKVEESSLNTEIEVKDSVKTSEQQFKHIEEDISEDDLKKALEDIENMSFNDESSMKEEIEKNEFSIEDDFTDLVKEKKEQPLKEFWD